MTIPWSRAEELRLPDDGEYTPEVDDGDTTPPVEDGDTTPPVEDGEYTPERQPVRAEQTD